MTVQDPVPGKDEIEEDIPTPVARGRDHALWLGVFLVLGLIAILGALFIFTDAAVFRGRYIVTTKVQDAGGIRRGDPVQMRGVNIGRIQRFGIHQGGVDIRLEIEGEYKMPSDSKVELQSAGLIGGMIAVILPGTAATFARGGDVLPGSTQRGMLADTDELAARVKKVTDEAARTLTRAQLLMSDETIRGVEATSTNAAASAKQLQVLLTDVGATVKKQSSELDTLVASLQRSSAGLEKMSTGPELDRARARIDAMTEKMAAASESFERTSKSLETVVARMDKGEGTLGKLSRDPQLYDNLNAASVNMAKATANINNLVEDIRRNPKKYLSVSVF